jgi:hypothetical protein
LDENLHINYNFTKGKIVFFSTKEEEPEIIKAKNRFVKRAFI